MCKEYIERKDAKKTMCRMCEGGAKLVCGTLNDCCTTMRLFDAIPAADVRPVVRGEWKDAMQSCNDSPHVKCSVCGEYYWRYFNKFNFCPNCGADMREGS